MKKLVFGAVLFALLTAPAGLHAQSTSVTFWICNAGKTDVDVFLSQSGKVTSNSVHLGECATMAHTEGEMAPAYVGLAFTDYRGQWGAARRHDIILDSDKEAFDPANQNVIVKHGNANVTLPMKLYFHPRTPQCHNSVNTPMVQYPSLAPTAAQKARAEAAAAANATVETTCENLRYELYVEAYPDTKELAFKKYCEACEKKALADETPAERASREQRAAATNSVIANMMQTPGVGGLMMRNLMAGVDAESDKQQKQREADLAPAMRVNWNDMQEYLYLAYRQDSRMRPVNQHIIVQGTIQSINVRATNPPNQIYDVYFKDDPKRQFAFCTSRPDTFQDLFGANFATAMPGKTVEVEGWLTKGCRDVDGGIQITLMRQLRTLSPGQTGAVAHVWSPAENPIPPTNPAPAATPAPAPPAAGAAPARGITRAEAAARPRNESTPAPAPTPAPRTSPSAPGNTKPTPATPAVPPTQTGRAEDPLVQSVLQLLRAKTPEPIILEMILARKTPLTLSGADRAKLEDAGASEKVLEALANPASISSQRSR